MSLHPSLKLDVAGSQQRSVLTRIERIKDLMKKGLWKEEDESKTKIIKVTGLPKTKVIKLKAKKAAKAKVEEGAPPALGAGPAAGAKPDAAKKPGVAQKSEGAKEKK